MITVITIMIRKMDGPGRWLVTDDGGDFADCSHKYWLTADSDADDRELFYSTRGSAGVIKVVKVPA